MFQTSCRENQNKTFYVHSPLQMPFMKYCGKMFRARPVTEDSMAHAHFTLDSCGYKYTLRTFNIVFPLQQWLRECASMLCYMYIACLVQMINLEKLCTWFSHKKP